MRQMYLEAAYSAPEEYLEKLQVPVGILGIPRKYFDVMLKPRELSTTRRISTIKPIPDFDLPPFISYKYEIGKFVIIRRMFNRNMFGDCKAGVSNMVPAFKYLISKH